MTIEEHPCPVCLRKRSRAALERDLATGMYTVAGAAAAHGIPESEVRYHVERCGAEVAPAPKGELDSPDAIMRTILRTAKRLDEVMENDAERKGYTIKAAAEQIRVAELRAKIAGIFEPDTSEGVGAVVSTQLWVNLVQVVQAELSGQPEIQTRLLAALEGISPETGEEDQAPGPVPAHVAPDAHAHVRDRWQNGGEPG